MPSRFSTGAFGPVTAHPTTVGGTAFGPVVEHPREVGGTAFGPAVEHPREVGATTFGWVTEHPRAIGTAVMAPSGMVPGQRPFGPAAEHPTEIGSAVFDPSRARTSSPVPRMIDFSSEAMTRAGAPPDGETVMLGMPRSGGKMAPGAGMGPSPTFADEGVIPEEEDPFLKPEIEEEEISEEEMILPEGDELPEEELPEDEVSEDVEVEEEEDVVLEEEARGAKYVSDDLLSAPLPGPMGAPGGPVYLAGAKIRLNPNGKVGVTQAMETATAPPPAPTRPGVTQPGPATPTPGLPFGSVMSLINLLRTRRTPAIRQRETTTRETDLERLVEPIRFPANGVPQEEKQDEKKKALEEGAKIGVKHIKFRDVELVELRKNPDSVKPDKVVQKDIYDGAKAEFDKTYPHKRDITFTPDAATPEQMREINKAMEEIKEGLKHEDPFGTEASTDRRRNLLKDALKDLLSEPQKKPLKIAVDDLQASYGKDPENTDTSDLRTTRATPAGRTVSGLTRPQRPPVGKAPKSAFVRTIRVYPERIRAKAKAGGRDYMTDLKRNLVHEMLHLLGIKHSDSVNNHALASKFVTNTAGMKK